MTEQDGEHSARRALRRIAETDERVECYRPELHGDGHEILLRKGWCGPHGEIRLYAYTLPELLALLDEVERDESQPRPSNDCP